MQRKIAEKPRFYGAPACTIGFRKRANFMEFVSRDLKLFAYCEGTDGNGIRRIERAYE
jgi:hypothetical protein